MHGIDVFLVIVFLLSMLIGFKYGFITMALSWLGVLFSVLMVVRFRPMVKYGIIERFSMGELFATILSYVLIFLVIAILVAFLKKVLNYLAKALRLSLVNRAIGAVFGFLNVLFILVLFLGIINLFPFLKGFSDWLSRSVIITEIDRIYDVVRFEVADKLEFF